jgi:hypothetical protein
VKTCRPCGRSRPLEAFYARRGSPDGRGPVCKECVYRQVKDRKARMRAGDEGPYDHHRFPVEPLLRAAGVRFEARPNTESLKADVADAIGVERATFEMWQRRGMRWPHADQAACALGLHPSDVWPEWWRQAV